jgi:ribulose-phosphate 3-epimerase
MAKIVPSILETTKESFEAKMSQVVKLPGVESIQVDFGDGKFVQNTMVPVTELDTLSPAFSWEAHLMIYEPKDFLDYKICGFTTIVIHIEAFPKKEDVANTIQQIHALGLKSGLAINPDTAIGVLKEFEGLVGHFLLMSVNPGFQGAPFIEESLKRIQSLRLLMPHAIIEVDGGVSLQNIHAIAKSGADLIIAGSALTKAPTIAAALEQLQVEMNKV